MSSETNQPWEAFSSPTVPGRRAGLVERFQASWRKGVRPDLASLVSQAEETERDALLKELVRLDAQSRRDLGESPVAADYLSAFPRCQTLIEDALSSSHDSTSPSHKLGTRPPGEPASGERPAPRSGQSSLPDSPSIPAPPRWQAPAVVAAGHAFGPYDLLSQLGQGGIGTVYKARHRHLDKLVCIKVLRPQFTHEPESILRFQREMKAVGRITHPNIVQAFDAGAIDGVHFLAMEYLEGVTLYERVYDKGRLTVADACKVISQSAQALGSAHQAGLVHRDVKPSNLFVTKSGHIKLLDLGLAKLREDTAANPEFTAVGQAFGTPDYMAPEQWSDARLADARADLYALGCTLFYVLTGRAPFSDDSLDYPTSKKAAHNTAAIPDLRALRADVPAGVNAIYRKLMAKSAQKRYQTAEELLKALAPFTADGPISESTITERRKPRKTPAQRWARERTYLVVVLATLAAATVGIGGWLLIDPRFSTDENAKSDRNVPVAASVRTDDVPTDMRATSPVTQTNSVVPPPLNSVQALLPTTPMPIAENAADREPIAPEFAQEPPIAPPGVEVWPVGSEPPWRRGTAQYFLRNDPVLIGIVERPRVFSGIKRWNVETVLPRAASNDIEWSPNGDWFATASEDGHVRIYDAASLEIPDTPPKLLQLIPGAGETLDLSWHPRSENLAILADNGQFVRVVQPNGQILWESQLDGIGHCVAWNREGTHLAVGIQPNPGEQPLHVVEAQIWKVKRFGEAAPTPSDPLGNASIAWGADKQTLVAVHADRTIRQWNIDTGQSMAIAQFVGRGNLTIDINGDGWLAVSTGKSVQVYDLHDHERGKEPRYVVSALEGDSGYDRAKWHPKGRQICCSGLTLSLWDPQTDDFKNDDQIRSTGASPWCWNSAGDRCLSADDFRLLNVSMEEIPRTPTHAARGVVRPYWSPDGKVFATSHRAGEKPLRIWDADGKQLAATKGPSFDTDLAEHFAWHPDSSELLVADTKKLFSFKIANQSTVSFELKQAQIVAAAWSLDGKLVLARTSHGGVLVFERTGRFVETLDPGRAPFANIATQERPVQRDSFGPWHKLSWPDADGARMRQIWAKSSVGPTWPSDGRRLLLGGTEVTALDTDRLQALWHAVALPDGRAVTFSAAGQLLHGNPHDVDEDLGYYVERENDLGRIETLTPAQFRQLVDTSSR